MLFLPPAGASAEGLSPEKFLQLAENMAKKQVEKAGKLESFEMLLLYLDILEGQGNFAGALEVVAGPLSADACLPGDSLSLRSSLAVPSSPFGVL